MTDDAPKMSSKLPSIHNLWSCGECLRVWQRRRGEGCPFCAAAARDATIAEQASVIEALNAEIARLHRPRCKLHGELADDGLCDVCEGRGLWEGV